MEESYYNKEEVLREPSLEVAQKLRHSNLVLEDVMDIFDDLKTSNSSKQAHVENRERLKWKHFAEDAEQYYQDAEYILDLLDGNIPTERTVPSSNMDIEWESPSLENPIFKAYREHEKSRQNYLETLETNEFQVMLSETFRYRQIINQAQKYDLPTETPFDPIDDGEILEEPAENSFSD